MGRPAKSWKPENRFRLDMGLESPHLEIVKALQAQGRDNAEIFRLALDALLDKVRVRR